MGDGGRPAPRDGIAVGRLDESRNDKHLPLVRRPLAAHNQRGNRTNRPPV